jgi:hypothetical protein
MTTEFRCSTTADGGPVVWVKAGADDKVFRLNKAAVDACKALDEQ